MNITIEIKLPDDTTMDNYQERADKILEDVKKNPLTTEAIFVARGFGNQLR
jgi:hypothetical protein